MRISELRKIYDNQQRREDYQAGMRAGFRAAAEFVSQWNSEPSKYRLDDLILCKFNQTSRKQPRLAKRKAKVK